MLIPWLDVIELAGVAVTGLLATVALRTALAVSRVAPPPVGRARVPGPPELPGDERPTLPRGAAHVVHRVAGPRRELKPWAGSVAVEERDASAYMIGYSDGWVDGAEGKPPTPPSGPRLTGDS